MAVEPTPPMRMPPDYCQYADGPCDQDFTDLPEFDALFLYASQPEPIAAAIESGVGYLRRAAGEKHWRTWRDLPIEGQVIFTEICKAMRFSSTVVADVTTLNFNLLFEIGFCIGLGLPVIPIRDKTYGVDQKLFDALGTLDTLGYIDFANGEELGEKLLDALPGRALPPPPKKTYGDSPLYVLKGPVDTEGAVQLFSTLKKSPLRFRTYDPFEKSRLTLPEARKQVTGSVGVVANLLSKSREVSTVHNALCALVCGIAMAEQKVVVMLQEEASRQPIDYRDVVKAYPHASAIPDLLEEAITQTVANMQKATRGPRAPRQEALLERVDLGDTAAENEIGGLRAYFVTTGQYRQALQGHARLVVGRKGTGKTAIFYAVRNEAGRSHSRLVLDLKPEGHQFTKLRESVLEDLPEGQREHTVAGFWNYILLSEIAHKILNTELHHAERDGERLIRYRRLEDAYLDHALASGDDLSQRLLRQVDRLAERFGRASDVTTRDDLTELIYGGDIRPLADAVADYLDEKEAVWLLIDNLDKGWTTGGATDTDILILRGLLEATRKLQRQLEARAIDFKCLVFIRTDIYEHLFRATPDKGKDAPIRLDWDDPGVFSEILRARIETSTDLQGNFDEVWRTLFVPHIATEDSFRYIVRRTLMRPRDLLTFVQGAIEVALNRGHVQVSADDIRHAEQGFSEEMLLSTAYEIDDTHAGLSDVMYSFQGRSRGLAKAELVDVLEIGGFDVDEHAHILEVLLWFSFLGARDLRGERRERYSYDVRFNLRQLTYPIGTGAAELVVHPAFCAALDLSDREQGRGGF